MFDWLKRKPESEPKPKAPETVLVDYTEASHITGLDATTIRMLVKEKMLTKYYNDDNLTRFSKSELERIAHKTIFVEQCGSISPELLKMEEKAMHGELKDHQYIAP